MQRELTFTLTPAELQVLAGLLDAGVKAVGLRALQPEALAVIQKLNGETSAPPKALASLSTGEFTDIALTATEGDVLAHDGSGAAESGGNVWALRYNGGHTFTNAGSGTSSTSLTIGTGTQSLTIEPGFTHREGQGVTLDAGAGDTMTGTLTSYDKDTGALVCEITEVTGSGTFGAWSVATTYKDDVHNFGINNGGAQIRRDPSKPTAGWTFESQFRQGATTPFGMEMHAYGVGLDGVSHRMISAFMPAEGGAGSILSLASDKYNWHSYDGQQIMALTWGNDHAAWNFVEPTYFNMPNGIAPFRQQNAAKTAFVPLPYIDGGDRMVVPTKTKFSTGEIDLSNIPQTDPGQTGHLWNDGGLLRISAGP